MCSNKTISILLLVLFFLALRCYGQGAYAPCLDNDQGQTIGQGFAINNQSYGVVSICPDEPLYITTCLKFPVNNINYPPSCSDWQNFWGTCSVPFMQYFYSFIPCNDDLSYNPADEILFYESINISEHYYGYQEAEQYDILYIADSGGVVLTPGSFYRFKIGGTYSGGIYEEYARFFYIISPDKLVQNSELNQQYVAANHLTFQNDFMHSGDIASAKARESITLLPNTDIQPGSIFTAEIDPSICPSIPLRKQEPVTTAENLSDLFNLSKTVELSNAITAPDINIFPNLTTGAFTLSLNETTPSELFIYNNLGQVVFQSSITNNQSLIDLSSHPRGIYFLKLQTADPAQNGAGKIYTEKIILQ